MKVSKRTYHVFHVFYLLLSSYEYLYVHCLNLNTRLNHHPNHKKITHHHPTNKRILYNIRNYNENDNTNLCIIKSNLDSYIHGLKTVGVSIVFAVATISLPLQSASATLTIPEIQGQVGKPSSSWDASSVSALESSLLKNSQQQQQQAREGGNSILLESSPSIKIKRSPRYWDAIKSGDPELIHESNEKLVDYIIGTTNTMYYDITGGCRFSVPCMNDNWKMFLKEISKEGEEDPLSSRENTVKGIKNLVATIGDPYSKYLTREELLDELSTDSSRKDGFLGLGALVEPPSLKVSMMNSRIKYYSTNNPIVMPQSLSQQEQKTTAFVNPFTTKVLSSSSSSSSSSIISLTRGENLPVVIAVSPDSPAERAGLVVGDR